MIELTREQRQELSQAEPTAFDPETKNAYVLVRKDLFDRLKCLLTNNEEWAEGGYELAMEVFARDGWDDPRMDVYDRLDPRRQA
jgi:hypothetical protein